LSLPPPFLGASKNLDGRNIPVTEIELEHGVSAGVQLRSPSAGLVPIYEEHETRLERGIDIQTWMEMEETEKALIVAARRIRIALANLQAEAEIAYSEREIRKHSRK